MNLLKLYHEAAVKMSRWLRKTAPTEEAAASVRLAVAQVMHDVITPAIEGQAADAERWRKFKRLLLKQGWLGGEDWCLEFSDESLSRPDSARLDAAVDSLSDTHLLESASSESK